MVEAIVKALLSICSIVLCYFLILWVLASIGIAVPAMVVKIIMVMLVLVCILILYRLFKPWFGQW